MVCAGCRSTHPGRVCPLCLEAHADRRRLYIGTAGKPGARRTSPKSALIRHGLAKRRLMVEDVGEVGEGSVVEEEEGRMGRPQILSVWSMDEAEQVVLEGPVVKQEQEEQEEEAEEQPTLNMSAVIKNSMVINKVLEVIDSTLLGGSRRKVEEEVEEQVEEQVATNYNDTPLSPLAVQQEVARISAPVAVSCKERRLMGLRERLAALLRLPANPGVEEQVEALHGQIARLRGEVEEEREQPEVMDPWAALQSLERRRSREGEMRRSGEEEVRRGSVDREEVRGAWREYRERAQARQAMTPPQAAVQEGAGPAGGGGVSTGTVPRGCAMEVMGARARQADYTGTITFSLMKNYSGLGLEWRTFLQVRLAPITCPPDPHSDKLKSCIVS